MKSLQELLGDALYQEVTEKLGGVRLVPEDEKMIPKHRFDCVNVMLRDVKEKLARAVAEAEELRAEAEKWKREALHGRVELALSQRRAKNIQAAKALIDFAKLELLPDGRLAGIGEEVARLAKAESFLFENPEQHYVLVPVTEQKRKRREG